MRSSSSHSSPLFAFGVIALFACGPQYPYTGSRSQPEPLPASRPVEGSPGQPVAAQTKPGTSKSAPAPAPKAAPAPKPEPTGDAMDDAAKAFIDAHNAVRAKHCAPPLTWSKKLAEIAQHWANTLKDKGCVFGHSPGMKYGENLAAGTEGALDPSSTVAMWYDEIKKYKFPNGGFSMETGHFTQTVWRSTKQVGCGHVT